MTGLGTRDDVVTTQRGFSVAGQRAVVVGAARSGIAAARLLAARGAHVVLSELRPELAGRSSLEAEGIVVELGGHDPVTLDGADLVVLSPGISPWQPPFDRVRRRGTPLIGELELASRWFEGRMVAITGTKGKSTSTSLLGEMLSTAGMKTLVGGNLGPAASLQVSETSPDAVHVVEASSFQLELTDTFRPDIAVFLNFSPDHLDRHRSVEEYAAAKARLFANQRPVDLAVVNEEDPEVLRLASTTRARRRGFALDHLPADGVGVRDGFIVRSAGGEVTPLVPVSRVRLRGRHLLADVLAATAVAESLGVTRDAIERAIEGFRGLEHALEDAGTVGGVGFVNDSKATNVEAARVSLEAFAAGVVAIMGGRFKGGDPRALAEALAARGRALVVIGESRSLFRDALGDVVPVVEAGSLEEAVRAAWTLARPDGTVLLAPACASFDMFRDYAERGCVFKEAVARLRAEVASGDAR
jgi:UDP-N-acetylmuramoylalanine--D-glutamate ligase